MNKFCEKKKIKASKNIKYKFESTYLNKRNVVGRTNT